MDSFLDQFKWIYGNISLFTDGMGGGALLSLIPDSDPFLDWGLDLDRYHAHELDPRPGPHQYHVIRHHYDHRAIVF